MAYSPARASVVLFGGYGPVPVPGGPPRIIEHGDTWEWHGTDWKKIPTNPGLSPRVYPAMAPDANGNLLLFGGVFSNFGFPVSYSDTWIHWNGQWFQMVPTTVPPARSSQRMAYDARRGRVVMHGGWIEPPTGGQGSSETWEWDGSDWALRTTTGLAVSAAGLIYDAFRERVVLFGGRTTFGFSHATSEWDGSSWIQRWTPEVLPAKYSHAMTYDAARERAVLFGGGSPGVRASNDQWEYAAVNPASYRAFGAGCAGAAGVPSLVVSGGQSPWIGSSFQLEAAALPASTPTVFFILGASNTRWGTTPLPLSLGGFSMPGCTLYTSVDLLSPVATSGGLATWTYSIPNNPWLVGRSVFHQVVVPDPGANATGVILSNAGEAKFGSK